MQEVYNYNPKIADIVSCNGDTISVKSTHRIVINDQT